MKNALDWIKNHKISTVLLCLILFFTPLIIIHIFFKWRSGLTWLAPEWSAGDLLAYIAGFEALLGTVILGLITVHQSQVANDVNERLSKENNSLQKISIQQMLPLLKVTELSVENSTQNICRYLEKKQYSVAVSEKVTSTNREIHLDTVLFEGAKDELYQKRVTISFENISNGPICKIAIDRIEFSGFQYKGIIVDKVACEGISEAKNISWLLLPRDNIDVVIDINFDLEIYRDFWEYHDSTSIGCFNMCLYLTNTSLSGVEYKEKIYVEKSVGFPERIMYKGFEEDITNA